MAETTGAEHIWHPRQRVRRVFSGSRGLASVVYRDPEHVAERLTLYAADRLGEPARGWARSIRAARPGASTAAIAESLRAQSARIARINGAISGTPFFIALVPGYLTFLWQEMRMTLRIAALYGRDPGDLETAAQTLALRRVHPDVQSARAALVAVRETPIPERPTRRRSLRTWVNSVHLLLIFGGFVSPPRHRAHRGAFDRIKWLIALAIAGVIWVTTWILPVTFMIVMAWGCEAHTRELGARALAFYGGDDPTVVTAIEAADRSRDRGHNRRAILRAMALFLSIAIPIGFVVLAVHVRSSTGITWLGSLGALVALSVVIASAVVSSRD